MGKRKTPIKQHRLAMQPQRTTVLSSWEISILLGLVLYFLSVLFREGRSLCARIAAAGIPIPGLRDGGFGTKVDLSDPQWRDFRASAPLLAGVLAAFVAASRAVQARAPERRVAFYLAAGLVFNFALHGACSAYVVALCGAGYALAQELAGRPYGLLAIWAWHCAVFLLVRAADGLPFAWMSPALAPLDAHRGPLRWHIHYNLLVLRLLSYSADLHWARTGRAPRTRLPPDTVPHPDLDLRARSELPLPAATAYRLPAFLAYCLYPPLYIAGPILTYNAFASQLAAPCAALRASAAPALRYLARAAGDWLLLEAMTRALWFFSITRHRLWAALAGAQGAPLSALEMVLPAWWMVLLVWIKFLVIWRFFRFWALADGVDAPENLTRCVCRSYDVSGFWRHWHASYNLWLVRYMYVPMGGSAWRVLNVWPIFTFVALWHDLEPKMLSWAWLMALILAPEAGAKWLAARPACAAAAAARPRAYRYVCAAAAAANLVLLIGANLVGFAFGGPAGAAPFVSATLGAPRFAPLVLLALFSGAQLSLALEDYEGWKARGGSSGSGSSSADSGGGGESGGGGGGLYARVGGKPSVIGMESAGGDKRKSSEPE